MADYNIIYIAEDEQHYLWNGSGFDLTKNENEKLMFSGKAYANRELRRAIKKCREAVKISFPTDKHPQIKKVEIPINSKDEISGHSRHITS
ncbi:hypothetical protein ACPPVU_07260 [Mucilaginibacter sp. McL0603]|uniref:hypothetical protein n=1 Tax=Mucilaginibacter sp. McL0603 TaxID=3415670 RepID=UPI003CF53D60